MEAEHAEAQWLTEESQFSLTELVELSGSSVEELRELVEYGAISPVNPESSQWVFPGQCLPTIRAACRLRVDFDLEPHGVALSSRFWTGYTIWKRRWVASALYNRVDDASPNALGRGSVAVRGTR